MKIENMKTKRLKSMLLPIGLLLLAGVPFVEHLMKVEAPDLANGFFRGVGIGLIISAIVMKLKRSRNLR